MDVQIERVVPHVRGWYQQIHRQPEVAKQEFKTAKLVRDALKEMGYTKFVEVDSLPTAVIAILETGKPGPTTCLRAELDALMGVTDSTDLPYKSQVPGVMHACGHDAHTAMLLGAAEILMEKTRNSKLETRNSEQKTHSKQRTGAEILQPEDGLQDDKLSGRIVFLFQPAEEAPGGANELVDWKVIEKLDIDRMFALHVTPGVRVGHVELSPGAVLAANRPFTLTITGRGSHAAKPHQGDDVLSAACEIVSGLVTLPARKLDVIHTPCVISVSRFQYGTDSTTGGVLSPDVNITGTIRSLIPTDSMTSSGSSIRSLVERYVQNTAEAYGVAAKLSLKKGPPPTVNDAKLYEEVSAKLKERWPAGKFSSGSASMTSEDFAYYTTATPCLYFRLGIAKDSLGYAPLHTSYFTVHPDAFEWGVKLYVELAFISAEVPKMKN